MSIALYRKYRPQKFQDIVGQEEVVTTIKNQVIKNKTSHAYLFCGTRGTGKTTTAKVFAKVVNCLSPIEGEPCMQCENCLSNSDSTLDIIEMDAATNNGVDDIRTLISRVQYTPSKLKYIVVIIDEVHMLSKGAFNSLLKTLEEPPSHVKFILATTEPQKIPATIRSRCQIYTFNRITSEHSVQRLKFVCQQEGIEVEEDALRLIASNSDGAMRDALSILDQLTSVNKKVTREMVEKKLGIMNQSLLMELTEAILEKQVVATLNLYRFLIDKGQDPKNLIGQLLNVIRDLLVYLSSKDSSNIEGLKEYSTWIVDTSKKVSVVYLSTVLTSLAETYNKLSYVLEPTFVCENEFVKLCNPYIGEDLNSLINRMESLEIEIKKLKASGSVIETTREVKILHIQNQDISSKTACVNEIVTDLELIDEDTTIKEEPVIKEEDNIQEVTQEVTQVEDKEVNLNLDLFSDLTKIFLSNTTVAKGKGEKKFIISTDIPVYEIIFNTLCKKELEEKGFEVEFVLQV